MPAFIPAEVKVCGKTYSVEASDLLEDSGNMIAADCKILLSLSQNQQQIRDSLLHELVHSIEYETHLNMEERQVHCLATALLDMLRSNPDLVRYLLDQD